MRDLYEVLGVKKTAAPDEIKKAYRVVARKYHPDMHPEGDKISEEKFKEAANAYQILSEPAQRDTYDRHGFDGLRRGGGGGGGPEPAGAGFGGGGFNNVNDIVSAFGDLFGDFFSAASRGRGGVRGADLRLDLDLTFNEAVWGTKKEIQVTRTGSCATCRGTGSAKGIKPEACRQCAGNGQVTQQQGFFVVQTPCAGCQGRGRTIKEPCTECRGRGLRTETSSLTIGVPPGVDNGQSLRVANKGETAQNGAAGDLYVVLRVTEDPRFARDDRDVTTLVSISFARAALGGEVEVATLDDMCEGTIRMEVVAGTQSGDVVMRRGQGIPNHDRQERGDHYVQFKIDVPRNLTSKQERLLREFAELDEDRQKRRTR